MQSEKYSRENAGQSLKKYILLRKGELAYNHGASKYKPFGCCFELKEDEARIPYVYHCFAVKENNDKSYIARLLNNQKIDQQLKRLISSSVRMDGLLNISYEEYTGIDLYLPSLLEQQKIADFLFLVDRRIEKQRQLVESLKKYKRGLLSAIFDHKLRFKDENGNDYPEWDNFVLDNLGSFYNGLSGKNKDDFGTGNSEYITYAAIHPTKYEMGGGGWIPRIDYVVRDEIGQPICYDYARGNKKNTSSEYPILARLVIDSYNYKPITEIITEGDIRIRNRANNGEEGKAPSYWIAVRSNLYVTAQYLYIKKVTFGSLFL